MFSCFHYKLNYVYKIEQTTTGIISVIRQNSVECGNCSDYRFTAVPFSHRRLQRTAGTASSRTA